MIPQSPMGSPVRRSTTSILPIPVSRNSRAARATQAATAASSGGRSQNDIVVGSEKMGASRGTSDPVYGRMMVLGVSITVPLSSAPVPRPLRVPWDDRRRLFQTVSEKLSKNYRALANRLTIRRLMAT
jgi:hypothetical protein